MKVAIVGVGVSGLVAAPLLHREHESTVYAAGTYPGGHTTRSGSTRRTSARIDPGVPVTIT